MARTADDIYQHKPLTGIVAEAIHQKLGRLTEMLSRIGDMIYQLLAEDGPLHPNLFQLLRLWQFRGCLHQSYLPSQAYVKALWHFPPLLPWQSLGALQVLPSRSSIIFPPLVHAFSENVFQDRQQPLGQISCMMQLPVARILAVAVSLCLLLYLTNISRGKWIDRVFRSSWTSAKFRNENTSPVEEWRQAINFPIVGLVFYGRREYVSILECYLQRNLRKNGGLLNEVIFLVRTEVAEDLGWLEQILQITPEYSKHTVATGRHGSYADAWDLVENGTLYIKIDDDVVFFEDHTIDAMVKRKLEHPEYFLIAANTINQPAQSWVHYHLGVAHPYLPELTPPPDFTTRSSYNAVSYHYQDKPTWRPSQLPSWIGPTDLKFDETYPAPFPGHRWLPLSPDADITTTPISIVDYTAAGPGWHSWAVGAQAHYSFLQNLENDQLHRYKYDIWDYEYDRISINLVLISGEDVRSVMPLEDDDELYLTMKAPRRLGRHAIMEGRGLAVHYGFGAQVMAHGWHGLRDTDVLDRYRAFARERVCGVPRGRRLAGP